MTFSWTAQARRFLVTGIASKHVMSASLSAFALTSSVVPTATFSIPTSTSFSWPKGSRQ